MGIPNSTVHSVVRSAEVSYSPPGMEEIHDSADRALEVLAAFVVLTGLVGLAAALAGVFHAPQVLLAGALATGGWTWLARDKPAAAAAPASVAHLALIAAVGLFFRLPPYNYVIGGQDEGIYVNIANTLARTGGVVPQDRVLESLRNPAAIDRYVADNELPTVYLPGVYHAPGDPRRQQFQFLHEFPVWMAISSGLFNPAATPWALTFLALVSLLFFYRLALTLTGDRRAALAAGLLLAVNPLHVFFSKFPVSEAPALAYGTMGFSLLALDAFAPASSRRKRTLVLSALSLFGLFSTRISGFMYLPFVALLAAVALLCDDDAGRRRRIHRWALATVGLCTIGVLYALRWSSQYARDVYRISFEGLLGENWQIGLAALLAVSAAAWLGIWLAARTPRGREVLGGLLRRGQALLGPAVLLVIAAAMWNLYRVGFTQHYAGDAWLETRMHVVGTRWSAFAISSLLAAAEYLSPLGFVAVVALALRKWREPRIAILLAFVVFFFAYVGGLQWFLPYQPYFARYLLSEFVPYALLFLVCAWAAWSPGRLRTALAGLLVLIGTYSAALSAAQIGKQENGGAYESLGALAQRIPPNALLLIDSDSVRGFAISELKTPLVYTFDVHVADASRGSLADAAYLAELRSTFDDVYLVSCASTAPETFAPVESLRFRAMAFEWGHLPPIRLFARINARLFLYKLDRITLSAGTRVAVHTGGLATQWLDTGWSPAESWGVWTVGPAATLRIDPRQLAAGIGALALQLKAFVSPQHPEQRVTLRLDGERVSELRFHYPDVVELKPSIPVPAARLRDARPLAIELDTPDAISPLAIGLNADERVIGVGLESVEFVAVPALQGRRAADLH